MPLNAINFYPVSSLVALYFIQREQSAKSSRYDSDTSSKSTEQWVIECLESKETCKQAPLLEIQKDGFILLQ